jgi:hypothetical protein
MSGQPIDAVSRLALNMRPANNWKILYAVMRIPVIESYPVMRTADERSAFSCSFLCAGKQYRLAVNMRSANNC